VDNSTLRVEMFGWLRVQAGGAVLTRFRTRKTAALFGYLAFHGERSHPRELLAEMLWPEARSEASRNSLSQALSSLRHELAVLGVLAGTLLETDRTTVQVHGRTDVRDFEAAARASGPSQERISALAKAQELYRGEFLPGHYDEWILAERERLRDLFASATHELVSLLRQTGDLRAATSAAHRAVREDPLSEGAVRDLMLAHADAHEPQLALRAYHELEANLKSQLDERPTATARELASRIAASSSPDGAPEPAPVRRATAGTATSMLVQIVARKVLVPPWARAMERALALATSEATRRGGRVVREDAASLVLGFEHPVDALDCAVQLRQHFRDLAWPAGEVMVVRLALDTFLLEARHANRAPGAGELLRLAQSGTSEDIVLSDTTAALVRRDLTPGLRIRESGGSSDRLYRLEVPREEQAVVRRALGG
jgi:DNA-binding SARP family transcriptional activator